MGGSGDETPVTRHRGVEKTGPAHLPGSTEQLPFPPLSKLHRRNFRTDLIDPEMDPEREQCGEGRAGKRDAEGNLFLPGSVYKNYPRGRCIRRTSSPVELPRKDTVCSSQEVFKCGHAP